MEWSQGDGWGDGPWDEADGPFDDGAYPPAPVPAHERTWRHPSEIGHAAWTYSEPPLVLGRGLMITTGVIGCALGLAILWLMVPSRGGFAPSAAPSSIGLRTASTLAGIAPVTTVVTEAEVTHTSAEVAIDTTSPLAALFGGAMLPAEDMPANTMHLDASENGGSAIVVAIGDSPYLVTTAHAVAGRTEVPLLLDSGESLMGAVVSVDATLAYIHLGDGLETAGFERASSAAPGDLVTVLAALPTTVSFGDAAALASLVEVEEGTPVVDEHGAIVALCSRASGALEMVPLGSGPDTDEPATTVPSTETVPGEGVVGETDVDTDAPQPWIGVRLGGVKGATDLSVTAVASNSPAEASGLKVGDEILSIDGVAVTTADQVIAAISGRTVGSTVAILVRTSPATGAVAEREITLVLGEREPTVDL